MNRAHDILELVNDRWSDVCKIFARSKHLNSQRNEWNVKRSWELIAGGQIGRTVGSAMRCECEISSPIDNIAFINYWIYGTSVEMHPTSYPATTHGRCNVEVWTIFITGMHLQCVEKMLNMHWNWFMCTSNAFFIYRLIRIKIYPTPQAVAIKSIMEL